MAVLNLLTVCFFLNRTNTLSRKKNGYKCSVHIDVLILYVCVHLDMCFCVCVCVLWWQWSWQCPCVCVSVHVCVHVDMCYCVCVCVCVCVCCDGNGVDSVLGWLTPLSVHKSCHRHFPQVSTIWCFLFTHATGLAHKVYTNPATLRHCPQVSTSWWFLFTPAMSRNHTE